MLAWLVNAWFNFSVMNEKHTANPGWYSVHDSRLQFMQSHWREHRAIYFFSLFFLFIRLAFKSGLRQKWCLTLGWTDWCSCCQNVLCVFLQIFICSFNFRKTYQTLAALRHFLSASQCFEVWSNLAAAARPQHPRHHVVGPCVHQHVCECGHRDSIWMCSLYRESFNAVCRWKQVQSRWTVPSTEST